MSKTTAPRSTPSPAKGVSRSRTKVGRSRAPRAEFYVAVLNMSWQLALVVLVPIIGGFELDQALDITPALTILGFVIAMAGMAAVVWRQLQIFAPPAPKEKHP